MKPSLRAVAGLAVSLLLAAASAVLAGTVYVPLPGVSAVGSTSYETQIFITNSLPVQRTVSYFQIATEVDGTLRSGQIRTPLPVAPATTSLLKPPAGIRGLLELSAPSGFHYEARLVGTGAAAGQGIELPVISSATLGNAGGRLVVQGLRSLGPKTADLVVVNLGKSASSCAVQVVRADGSLAFPSATIALLPLSHRYLSNVFSGVPAGIADARAEVSCNTEFFAYVQMTDTASGDFSIATPSETSASTLVAPGDTPVELECSAGTVCYAFPGSVHVSTSAKPDRGFTFEPAPASYSSVKVHLEVTINSWNPPASGAHGVLYFVRNRNRDMFANIFLRGPGKDQLTLRHGFDQSHPEKAKLDKGFAPQLGTTYAFDYDYDPAGRSLSLRVSHDGQLDFQLTDRPNVNAVQIASGDRILLGLGNPGTNPAIEPSSIGWVYSNLKVELFP